MCQWVCFSGYDGYDSNAVADLHSKSLGIPLTVQFSSVSYSFLENLAE